MNIWRVTSKTGKIIHLTYDREKTLCGRLIKDDWKFLYLLRDKTEALEHADDLCSRCNDVNLEEWEKELDYDKESEPADRVRENGGRNTESSEEPVISVRSDRFI